ncbi:MAG: YggS family pyridoxal phosphate-dependent enzyme [Alphaproteobacteria bacterium]|nr:YggS family pyridoxal phosphate-dependent enzyme [Alphaproteobacteria bacterium]
MGEDSGIADRIRTVRARVAAAARDAGRSPADVAIVAVAKTHGAAAVEAALGAGQLVFGENRVQEAQAKYPSLRQRHPDLRLHLIGPLQSNKVKLALELFDVIHTLDRPKLAAALAGLRSSSPSLPALYVQVNTGLEPQKSGIAPADAVAFVRHCVDALGLPVVGLMCIPPVDVDPIPHFALLRELGRESGLGRLSMGMSDDFEAAVRLGATEVRVGSAIFGGRAGAQEAGPVPPAQ